MGLVDGDWDGERLGLVDGGNDVLGIPLGASLLEVGPGDTVGESEGQPLPNFVVSDKSNFPPSATI